MKTSLPKLPSLIDEAYALFLGSDLEKPFNDTALQYSFEVISKWPEANRDLLCLNTFVAYLLAADDGDKISQQIFEWLMAQEEKRLIVAVFLSHLPSRQFDKEAKLEGKIFIHLSNLVDMKDYLDLYSKIVRENKPSFYNGIIAQCGCNQFRWHFNPKDRVIVMNCCRLLHGLQRKDEKNFEQLWATTLLHQDTETADQYFPKTQAAITKLLINDQKVVQEPLFQAIAENFRGPLANTILDAVLEAKPEWNRRQELIINLTAAAEMIVDAMTDPDFLSDNELAGLRQKLADSQCAWIWRIAPQVCQVLDDPELIYRFIAANHDTKRYTSNTIGNGPPSQYHIVGSLSLEQTIAFAKIALKDTNLEENGWPFNIQYSKKSENPGKFWQELKPLFIQGYGSPDLIYALLTTLPKIGQLEISVLKQWLKTDQYNKLYKSDPVRNIFRQFIIPYNLRPGKLLNPDAFWPNVGYELKPSDCTEDGVRRLLPGSAVGCGGILTAVQSEDRRKLLLESGYLHKRVLHQILAVFYGEDLAKQFEQLEKELMPMFTDDHPQSVAFRQALFEIAWPKKKEDIEYHRVPEAQVMARILIARNFGLPWMKKYRAKMNACFEENWYFLFTHEPQVTVRIFGIENIRTKFFAHFSKPDPQIIDKKSFLTQRIGDWEMLFQDEEGRKELGNWLYDTFWHFANLDDVTDWLIHFGFIKEQRFRLLLEQAIDLQDNHSNDIINKLQQI